MDPYNEAHLFVAALRLLQHQKQSPPTIEDVSSSLELSVEAGLATCRKLEKLGIIQISEDPFTIKVSIDNHLEIEKLPKELQQEDSLSKEVEQFMEKKKETDRKVETIQADLQKKKQNLQDDFEARLRKEIEKMQKGGS